MLNGIKKKKKCFAGYTVSGANVGVNKTANVSGEVLSFLSTGIDTRVYFIKNFQGGKRINYIDFILS